MAEEVELRAEGLPQTQAGLLENARRETAAPVADFDSIRRLGLFLHEQRERGRVTVKEIGRADGADLAVADAEHQE